jgi:shikimate dehydrogenase
VLHRAAYAALGLSWWRYDAIECDAAGLPALLDNCGPDWAGLSLTMPLKRAVLPLLDRIDPLVTEVGGANTVVLAAAQRLGYNTDVPGMVRALGEHGIGAAPPLSAGASPGRQQRPASPAGDAGPAVILGAGATACGALAALRDLGERAVTVAVRDLGRAGDMRLAADRLGMAIEVRPIEVVVLAGRRLVISTLPAGAADFLAEQLPLLTVLPDALFDVVYQPWPTPLATAAAAAGLTVVGGFDLLLHQAGLQVELMTGRPAPLEQMRAAGRAELAHRAGQGSPG